jgi:hypothetical protein
VSWFVTVVTVGMVTPDCVACRRTLPDEFEIAAVPVPSTSKAPALPLATLGRAVRPKRTVSVGSAAVVTMFKATVIAPVPLNLKPMLFPFVSAWLMAYL